MTVRRARRARAAPPAPPAPPRRATPRHLVTPSLATGRQPHGHRLNSGRTVNTVQRTIFVICKRGEGPLVRERGTREKGTEGGGTEERKKTERKVPQRSSPAVQSNCRASQTSTIRRQSRLNREELCIGIGLQDLSCPVVGPVAIRRTRCHAAASVSCAVPCLAVVLVALHPIPSLPGLRPSVMLWE